MADITAKPLGVYVLFSGISTSGISWVKWNIESVYGSRYVLAVDAGRFIHEATRAGMDVQIG